MDQKKRKRTKKWILSAVLMFCILCLGGYCMMEFSTNQAEAACTQETGKVLSFKSVYVTKDDTLWSIAQANYSAEYGSLRCFVKEIKRCNHLSGNRINAGSCVIVPVYLPKEQAL